MGYILFGSKPITFKGLLLENTMAEIIPPLNRQTLSRMTAGEKRLARRLESLLEDDYLVW